MKHPAKYSDSILRIIAPKLSGLIYDPFGGTSKLKELPGNIICSELEPEWAAIGADLIADALIMPFADSTFDTVCTSPTYGNRMADHHNAKDNSQRNTYRHTLGRPLHPNNSGQLQWGSQYKKFHEKAWQEVYRVLKPGGKFILNVSNHIRKGREVNVCMWHYNTVIATGFDLRVSETVTTSRNRFGANGEKRVAFEYVMEFVKGK